MARAGPYVSWRWRLGPARFGSYFGGCFSSIYRTSSMPAFGLGCCDRCHRLLLEYPIIFWTPWARSALPTCPAVGLLYVGHLRQAGQVHAVAGAPPAAFSADGEGGRKSPERLS